MNTFKSCITGLLPLILLMAFTVRAQRQPVPQLGKSPLKEIVAAMTLEEKVTLVVGAGKAPKPKSAGSGVSNGWVPEPPMIGYTETKVPGAAGNTNAIPRLGIPSLVLSDGPAGVRISPKRKGDSLKTYYATAFPVGTLLASTWDPVLVNHVGKAFGNEVLEYGVDILLAPGVNIHRNPLNGRNFEYFSEDPLVSGKMAAALINGVQSNGVGTSIKHFVANNQESNRNYNNSVVSERALRELELKTFQLAIAGSNPWTVMSSYNRLNGVYTAQRYDLLTTVLRKEWNFKGLVMTDWGGGYDWVEEMKAGNDLIMPGRPDQIATLIAAVKEGALSEKVLDDNVTHILSVILKTPAFRKYAYSNHPDLKTHAAIARQAAAEGMVLLKNSANILPLSNTVKHIAAFGNTSYKTLTGGTGSGEVNKAYVISVCEGLTNAGYQPDTGLKTIYAQFMNGSKPKPSDRKRAGEMHLSDSSVRAVADRNDLALITVGRITGEGWDRDLQTNYMLTPDEQQQFKLIADAFHARGKKVVAVLNIGGVIDMNGWQDYADAILLAWQPGQEAGNAIADLLSGKVNPSGKLATTFPASYTDVPSAKTFPGVPASKPENVYYNEGIYVGYRYYDTFNKKPIYEFGYGLSYTDFEVSRLTLSSVTFKDGITARVSVTNTGKMAGKEVIQIYVSAPTESIDKPQQELKAFGKTRLLQPGETQELSFILRAADLASYHTDRSAWITDAGNYLLKVGVSSRDIKQTARFSVSKAIVTEQDQHLLQPDQPLEEISTK